ncbi:MAG: NADH-quinone oxidoreductase subunit A [Desulfobacterales bacterium]|jgi:NADH-quinone oxidoreductase subunit A
MDFTISTLELTPWQPEGFSLVVYGMLVFILIAGLLILASRLGAQRPTPEKLRPYESGIIPTGNARLRRPVPFFLVAIFFLLFDVESAFIFAWAVALEELGWAGWLQITFFIGVLILGLVYIWRRGGLAWGPTAHRS